MKHRLKYYQGVIVFIIVMAVMIFIGAPVQQRFGIWGVALTELFFLVAAVASAMLFKADMREVFPLRLPPVKQFFGGAFIYIGSYIAMIGVTLIIGELFPEIDRVTDVLYEVGTQESPVITMIIMAVLPAVCEEALHRGFILSSFRSVNSRAFIVISAGIVFGIFHWDLYRLLPTAMLGMAFAYIALKTESIVLPVIFHFCNNMMSVVAILSISDIGEIDTSKYTYTPEMLAGMCLFYFGAAVILIYGGSRLLDNKRASLVRTLIAVIIANTLMIGGGIVLYIQTYGDTGYKYNDFGDFGEYGNGNRNGIDNGNGGSDFDTRKPNSSLKQV